jgi:outer membrane protein TolC
VTLFKLKVKKISGWVRIGFFSAGLLLTMSLSAHDSEDNKNVKIENGLKLKSAILAAQSQDSWLKGSWHKEISLLDLSKVEGALPDPQVTIGIANLAVDSFDFNQEGMTQLRIGASQMFPRGDTLELRQKKLEQKAAVHPLERLDRKAKVAVMVTDLWLDAFTAQESIKLIVSKRELFEQLGQVAEANYANAVGKVRQHNIIRAQLELTQLEDRLIQLKRKKDAAIQGLVRWIGHDASQSINEPLNNIYAILPTISPLKASLIEDVTVIDNHIAFEQVRTHPAILQFDQQLQIADTDIALQKQRSKTQWGISSAYGHRADAKHGDSRSDLISVGVMFDLPLFSSDIQSKAISAAKSGKESIQTAKWDFVREFIGQFRSIQSSLRHVEARQSLFNGILLPQMHDQADASLSAYTNDDGEFSEVVRARIAELNAAINALSINTEKQKLMMRRNYFLMSHPNSLIDQISQIGALK